MKPSKTSLNQIGVSASLWMKKLGFVWLLCGASCWSEAAVVFVRADQTNSTPDGMSWTTAYRTVQAGINAGSEGDAVWVAAGTYYENLTLSNSVALYGGFAGTETDLDQRDWKSRFSILDGRQTNSVVSITGGTNTTRLDGFVVHNGNAVYGGGVYCSNAAPEIVNNVIVQNLATNHGGGIYCYQSSPVIASNMIQGNLVVGAMYGGAGIGCDFSAPKIRNNRLLANSCQSELAVGAISCRYAQAPDISDNVVVGNFAGRILTDRAAGISVFATSAPRIVNNTIAWCSGTGLFCDSNTAVVANNIVAFCDVGVHGVSGMTFRRNCVFGNTSNFLGFPNPTGVNGNISVNPQFVPNPQYPDIHLAASSSCIGTGDNGSVPAGASDMDGEARVVGLFVDIGADEFNGTTPVFVPRIVRVSTGGDDGQDGFSWAAAKRTVQAGIDAATLNGGEVWIQAGIYAENLQMRHSVYLYGGFAGAETNRGQRDWSANPTILDGNSSGSVITLSNLLQWNGIDGFVIRNGEAHAGAGIFSSESAPTIANNIIVSNVATSWSRMPNGLGGGIHCVASRAASSPVIVNNDIRFNSAVAGGGLYCAGYLASPQIRNNRFEANVACVVNPSLGGAGGGGILVDGAGTPFIEGNFFFMNVATNGPDSSSTSSGGAISVAGATMATIVNNTVIGNLASSSRGFYSENGGGIYSQSASTLIANNLIVFGSSGIYTTYSGDDITRSNVQSNCIFGNATNYLRMPDLSGTNGNISADPRLVSSNDYHLGNHSPCINAGNNTVVAQATDLDGNPRIQGGTVDIGADEFQTPGSVLSYAWAQQFGLPVDGSADYVDTDGDCLNSWQEWRAGTVPTNAASVLKLLPPVPGAGGTLVSWQSVSGRTYLLERSTNLAAQPAFSTVQSNLAGVDGITSCTDTNAVGDGPCFYRIGLQQ